MGELERNIAIVGAGRLGTVLAAIPRTPPSLGRVADARGAGLVLLCVPDAEIAGAAATVAAGPLVGHCSGATGLASLAPHEAFSVHPLMRVPAGAPPGILAGAGSAAVEDWAALGPADPLTEPIARGDAETVERHRLAPAEGTLDLPPLYDVPARATHALKAAA